MKSFLLLLLSSLLFALPAFAGKVKLVETSQIIRLTGTATDGQCVPWHSHFTNYILGGCSYEYTSWAPERNVTITEIEVMILIPTVDQNGICDVTVYTEDSPGADTWNVVASSGNYCPMNGLTATGDSCRHNVDIALDRGEYIVLGFNDFAGIPAACESEVTDPTVRVILWGEYTD